MKKAQAARKYVEIIDRIAPGKVQKRQYEKNYFDNTAQDGMDPKQEKLRYQLSGCPIHFLQHVRFAMKGLHFSIEGIIVAGVFSWFVPHVPPIASEFDYRVRPSH